MLRDYHVHSTFSIDGESTIEQHCQRGIELGIAEIAFTEHYDLHPLEPGHGFLNWERYVAAVAACRERYQGKLRVVLGLELGEPHRYREDLQQQLASYPVDFLLGSVHWVGNRALHQDFCDGKNEQEAYGQYLEQILNLARYGDFDVLGHLDVLERYTPASFPPFDPEAYLDLLEEILRVLIARGKGLEINTSGWRQGLGRTFPSLQVLRWYRQLGGEVITVGSDAHSTHSLGWEIRRGYQLAQEAGFDRIAIFRGRQHTLGSGLTL